MGHEMMGVDELAAYLRRDAREVGKLASKGHLPGYKVSGEWRFARAEINRWLESQLSSLSQDQLTALETSGQTTRDKELLLTPILSAASVAVPLRASTRASVLKELVSLAEQSWNVFDSDALLEAIKAREEIGSTALPSGVAIPHPNRPMSHVLGDSVLVFAHTSSGIPFGGLHGGLTDLFFLVCCKDHQTHLRVMARLTRLLLKEGFLDQLRAVETPTEAWETITAAEQLLVDGA